MIQVERNKGESFEAFMRRFRKAMTMSGTLLQARKIQYFDRTKSKNIQKNSAVTRKKMGEKRAYLIKTGKVKEEDLRGKRRRRR